MNKKIIRQKMSFLAQSKDERIIEFGEICATKLAETTADELEIHDVLDDPNHFIWDLALEISEIYNGETT